MSMRPEIEETFKQILELKPGKNLPKKLVDFYCKFKRAKDLVMPGDVSTPMLVLIACLYDKAPENIPSEPPIKAVPDVDRPLNKGDKVVSRCLNRKVHGTFISYSPEREDECAIEIEDDLEDFRIVKIKDTYKEG